MELDDTGKFRRSFGLTKKSKNLIPERPTRHIVPRKSEIAGAGPRGGAFRFLADNPETMPTTVAFAAESAGCTRVTVTCEPHGPATAEEIETFRQARGGMSLGWTGSFNKLEECIVGKSAPPE